MKLLIPFVFGLATAYHTDDSQQIFCKKGWWWSWVFRGQFRRSHDRSTIPGIEEEKSQETGRSLG